MPEIKQHPMLIEKFMERLDKEAEERKANGKNFTFIFWIRTSKKNEQINKKK